MNKLNKTISQIWNDNYVVPIYQRNYAWGEDQIAQLLQDIYDASQTEESNYFIGSLVVLQRTDGVFEVIDGQQRLTTLHLICKELGILRQSHLTYDSRPETEDFFNQLFASKTCEEFLEDCSKRDVRNIFHLVEALEILENVGIHTHAGHDDDKVVSLKTMEGDLKNKMAEYLNNNVILVRTILPDDTDVAAYFEIMNNRGEQLQEHEIVKALMMKSLNEVHRQVFSSIWDACSQMNVPIQRSLSSYRNNSEYPLFGLDFNGLHEDYLDQYKQHDTDEDFLSLEEILLRNQFSINENTTNLDDDVFDAIIDFPNFLMHVFKSYDNGYQLNANYLQESYEKLQHSLEFDSMEFVKRLLKFRTLFDRYVVKTLNTDNEESIRWMMKKPYKEKKDILRFRNTFSVANDEPDENESEDNLQKRIIKQQSMLQVTFRNKKYKNWLFDYLRFLNDEVGCIDAKKIITFLDRWMLNFYTQLLEKNSTNPNDCFFEALGVDTPHFLFNFIDYLYWVESCNPNPDTHISYIEEVKDFDFKYYNSVEHHLPQSYENIEEVNIDNIGNLCLISRSSNSSLNDKAPKEKARIVPGLSPKRRIMYTITQNNNGIWDKKRIEEHCGDIKDLLDKSSSILNI